MITIFHQTALTSSYSTSLKGLLEATFSEYSNVRHQNKDASEDMGGTAKTLAPCQPQQRKNNKPTSFCAGESENSRSNWQL